VALLRLDRFQRFFEDPKMTLFACWARRPSTSHGGVATNVPMEEHPWPTLEAEYEAIRGKPYEPAVGREPVYLGTIPKEARHLAEAGDAGGGGSAPPK
jgi:hypothetical protein